MDVYYLDNATIVDSDKFGLCSYNWLALISAALKERLNHKYISKGYFI